MYLLLCCRKAVVYVGHQGRLTLLLLYATTLSSRVHSALINSPVSLVLVLLLLQCHLRSHLSSSTFYHIYSVYCTSTAAFRSIVITSKYSGVDTSKFSHPPRKSLFRAGVRVYQVCTHRCTTTMTIAIQGKYQVGTSFERFGRKQQCSPPKLPPSGSGLGGGGLDRSWGGSRQAGPRTCVSKRGGIISYDTKH